MAPPTPPNPASPHPALTNPALASEKAPDKFKAKISTTKGDFTLEITREWAPLGADRFYNMVKIGYFNDVAFFRNVKGFMVQFGIHGDPAVNTAWRSSTLQDDPVVQSNLPGFITYAKTSLPNSRSTQFFINFGNNARLDGMGFAPFGKVVEGMNIVESLFNGYGETPSQAQGAIQSQGNAFLRDNFPNLDYIKSAAIVP